MGALARLACFGAGVAVLVVVFMTPGDQVLLAAIGGGLVGLPLGYWITAQMLRGAR